MILCLYKFSIAESFKVLSMKSFVKNFFTNSCPDTRRTSECVETHFTVYGWYALNSEMIWHVSPKTLPGPNLVSSISCLTIFFFVSFLMFVTCTILFCKLARIDFLRPWDSFGFVTTFLLDRIWKDLAAYCSSERFFKCSIFIQDSSLIFRNVLLFLLSEICLSSQSFSTWISYMATNSPLRMK